MSWFTLKEPTGTNYRVEPDDIMNTKRALNQLGYYDVPPHRGIDDWTDDPMFDGIRKFQKDNALKVDGFMRPGGPTEATLNRKLAIKSPATEQPGESDRARESRIDFLEHQITVQRERIRQLKAAGSDSKTIREIEWGIGQMEAELSRLNGKGSSPSWWPF